MTIAEFIKYNIDGKTPDWTQVGRDFFAQGFNAAETREFLLTLMQPQNMEGICETVCAAYMNNRLLNLDYTNFTGLSTLDSRYFNIFIALTKYANLTLKDIFPFLLYVFSAKDGSRTANWQEAAEKYIFKEAGNDFEKILSYYEQFDTKFAHYGILLKIDYSSTVAFLIERYINGSIMDRAYIKKFFLNYKPDIVKFLMQKYENADIKQRRAIVQLLLIYKNEGLAAEFLNYVLTSKEKTVIKQIILKNFSSETTKRKKNKIQDQKFSIFDAMVNGTLLTPDEFNEKILGNKKNSKIAETIFFTVIAENDSQTDLLIIDRGIICGLDNEKYKLPENCKIGVLHPCDIQFRHDFIKRLNIEQHFEQLKRKVYRPDNIENKGYSTRLSGRLVSSENLIKQAKKLGFRFINKEDASDLRCAAIFKEGYVFVIEFSKADASDSSAIVSAGNIKFYKTKDLIKMRGQYYTKNVPLFPASEIPLRVFSELMYGAFKLLEK